MRTSQKVIIVASSSTLVLALFIALAQAQLLFLPYFTPTKIEFYGLEDQYPVNGSMTYTISLKGYGSNCIGFTAQTLRKESSLPGGEERVAYFSKTDDCRKISISQGAYNYSQNFSYSGHIVLGEPGDYKVKVDVLDQITRQNYTDTRIFTVGSAYK
jgi:hypothetical protein